MKLYEKALKKRKAFKRLGNILNWMICSVIIIFILSAFAMIFNDGSLVFPDLLKNFYFKIDPNYVTASRPEFFFLVWIITHGMMFLGLVLIIMIGRLIYYDRNKKELVITQEFVSEYFDYVHDMQKDDIKESINDLEKWLVFLYEKRNDIYAQKLKTEEKIKRLKKYESFKEFGETYDKEV